MEGARDRRPDALGNLQYLPDEELCRIVSFLAPKDVGSLACVSSIFYVICNEEPLWMDLCMENHSGLIEYKGSWKLTTLEKLGLVKNSATLYNNSPLHFDGFSSLFLYRRWYRCHVVLEGFVAPEAIERREKVTPEEFSLLYDGKRPVVLTDLTEEWPAKDSWSMEQLVGKYGDIAFKVGQSHGKKVMMKLKDYATYMAQQHDEEPLYVFDPKFGKYAPPLLEDYKVPSLFSEDLLRLLDEERPPFRWLVIGPCRSGASWHVDPALTSAWNTLLCGRKRWALYPPGRVPPAVTVHVDEDEGDIDFDGPTSLQWWMDVYPSLKDEDKPVEYIQHPGETIFVPSGWWHCILNIDTTVAVTQNFVNKTNLELVCLDMAPGYRHRGIARAGNIALSEVSIIHKGGLADSDGNVGLASELETASADCKPGAPGSVSLAPSPTGRDANGRGVSSTFAGRGISEADAQLHYSAFVDFNILSSHIEEHPDHFNSKGSSGYLGPRLLRLWLCKLWTARPDLQPLIWKSACRVLDSDTWLRRVTSICEAYGFPGPDGVEQLPVGDGSNPVFLVGDKVIKFYVEDGLQGSVDVLGSELEFYALIRESKSPLEKHIPAFVGSGIIYPDGEKFKAVPWDGVGEIPAAEGQETSLIKKRMREREKQDQRIRTKWSRFAERDADEQEGVGGKALFCPYIIMERCMGKNLAEVRKDLTGGDMMQVASFLGQQVRNLHSVPLPDGLLEKDNGNFVMGTHVKESRHGDVSLHERNPVPTTPIRNMDERVKPGGKWTCTVPWEWKNFVRFLREKREQITDRLDEWEMIPDHLTKQVDFYLPKDPATVIDFLRIEGDRATSVRHPVWIHMDIMLDNVQMAPNIEAENGESVGGQGRASHIIDFGDLNLGDPLYDFIAIYLDIFRGDVPLMQRFLQEYDLPVWAGSEGGPRVSYKAMCYVLLYRLRAGKVLFQVKEALRSVETWEEVEEQVFGFLNDWQHQQTCGERGNGHGIDHRQQR